MNFVFRRLRYGLIGCLFLSMLVSSASFATGQTAGDLPLAPPVLRDSADALPDGVMLDPVPEPVPPVPDPVAEEQIQRALRGDQPAEIPPNMLGDVLGIIRRQGSVLDGSSLDPRFADGERVPQHPAAGPPQTQPRQSHVQTAEALLRAARMLEMISVSDKTPPVSELIRHMRLQATRLLIAEYPEAVR